MKLILTTTYVFGIVAAAAKPDTASKDDSRPTVVQRDLPTITSAFASVGSGISDLAAAVKQLSGAGDVAKLQSASSALLDSIKSGAAAVQASSALTLEDAVQLQTIATGLQTRGETLGKDLVSKKPVIESLSLCTIFQVQAGNIAVESKRLSDAVVSKVPQEARQIAARLASGFTNTLAQTQQSFAEGNCTNGASGSGAPTTATPGQSGEGPRNGAVTGAANNLGAGRASTLVLVSVSTLGLVIALALV